MKNTKLSPRRYRMLLAHPAHKMACCQFRFWDPVGSVHLFPCPIVSHSRGVGTGNLRPCVPIPLSTNSRSNPSPILTLQVTGTQRTGIKGLGHKGLGLNGTGTQRTGIKGLGHKGLGLNLTGTQWTKGLGLNLTGTQRTKGLGLNGTGQRGPTLHLLHMLLQQSAKSSYNFFFYIIVLVRQL